MPNEFWAAIIGAVVGAVTAGIISYLIQRTALKATADQLEKEAENRKKALGYALLFKMVRIYSGLAHMSRHLEEHFKKLEQKEYAGSEPWQIVLPIANPLEAVHFSTDEMAMLLSLKDNDLFNDLASLDVVHNSTIELFRTHASLRAKLLEMLPANIEGMVGEVHLTAEQAMYVRPKMVEINALIIDINERCTKDTNEAKDILQRLSTTLNNKLELSISLLSKAENAR